MAMKPGIVGYVPPPSWPSAKAFLGNVQRFKTVAPIIIFSEYKYPGVTPIRESPEVIKGGKFVNGKANPFSVNNLIFFTACRIAAKSGFTHMFYLESDCRVYGDNWDQRIWDEAAALEGDWICAGTVVCYNPCNGGIGFARRWNDLIVETNQSRLFPLPTYGFVHAGKPQGASVFVNGALGLYSIEWMGKLFDLSSPMIVSQRCTAWDYEMGLRMFKRFGVVAFDMVRQINSIYSGYGDVMTSELERIMLLREGKLAAVHQVKSCVEV